MHSNEPYIKSKLARILIAISLFIFYSIFVFSSVQKPDTTKAQAYINDRLSVSSDIKTSNHIDYGAMRASVAFGEYNKGVKETVAGCHCGTDVEKYTLGLQKQWCSMFSSWVFHQAGSPLSINPNDDSWRIEQARDIAKWLQENGEWHTREEVLRENLTPDIGDVVIFWRGNFDGNLGHADIVVGLNPNKPGTASLIGGNLNSQVTYREDYRYTEHFGFLGFGRTK